MLYVFDRFCVQKDIFKAGPGPLSLKHSAPTHVLEGTQAQLKSMKVSVKIW